MQTIPAKTIVTRTKSSTWFGADYTMNIYRGCSHGCIYCDSRSSCYQVDDFDTVKAKENALQIIRDDLKRKIKSGVVATGAMSDPYNPLEADYRLTRHALELINAYRFGVAITTKSPLVTRDTDVLSDIKVHSPVLVKITITTADDSLARRLEPRAAASGSRFQALSGLAEAGLFAGVLMMPLLPYINDTADNVLAIVRQAKESGARFVYPSFGLTLRANQRLYYFDQLDRLFPGLKEIYQQHFGYKYSCLSPHTRKLWPLFQAECERFGLLYKMNDIIWHYKLNYTDRQPTLF